MLRVVGVLGFMGLLCDVSAFEISGRLLGLWDLILLGRALGYTGLRV